MGSAVTGGAGREKTENLAKGLGELHAEKTEDGNDHVKKNSGNKLAVPIELTCFRAIYVTQKGVAIHLHAHEQGHPDKSKNDDPVEENDQLVRLKRVVEHLGGLGYRTA